MVTLSSSLRQSRTPTSHKRVATSVPALRAATVQGPIAGDELGSVLPDEHVPIDHRNKVPTRPPGNQEEVGVCENVGAVRIRPLSCGDNLILDRDNLGIEELTAVRTLGGSTIVEKTTTRNGRNIHRVVATYAASGVSIVATTGCYVRKSHTPEIVDDFADQLAALLTSEIVRPHPVWSAL